MPLKMLSSKYNYLNGATDGLGVFFGGCYLNRAGQAIETGKNTPKRPKICQNEQKPVLEQRETVLEDRLTPY